MYNKLSVILTISAVMICIIVCVKGDSSETYNDNTTEENTNTVVIKDDSLIHTIDNVGLGLFLIGASLATCGFCVHEIRKDRYLKI